MWLVPPQHRPFGLFLGSVAGIIWILSDGGLTSLDALLVTMTLLMIGAVWWIIRPVDYVWTDNDYLTSILGLGSIAVLWVSLGVLQDDDLLNLLIFASPVVIGGVIAIRGLFTQDNTQQSLMSLAQFSVVVIIIILVAIKVPQLADFFGYALDWDAQSLSTASPFLWLGFSYIAFRLMALLFDFRAGRLSKTNLSLRDTITYVIFFPAFTAGPIDRAQRFLPEIAQTKPLDASRMVEGTTRIAVGVFKKFVIADSLALIAMSPQLIEVTDGAGGFWLMLYLYAFQIFFDFSGYSDVAIGLGRLYGITLPENFDRPYLQPNVQQFWQRWHITLSTWFRVYYFTPLSRFFITRKRKPPNFVIILVAQLTTMGLIGLWHGITWNFLLWGLWHGLGLFAHKMLADNTRGWTKRVNARVWSRRLMYWGSVFVTFNFVALGWVFFALPNVDSSLNMLARLFGFGG